MQGSSTICDRPAIADESWQTQRPSVRYRAAAFWIYVLFWLTATFPKLTKAISWFGMTMTWIFAPSMRAVTMDNSKWLLGGDATWVERRRMAKRVIYHFVQFICEVSRYGSMTKEQLRDQIEQVNGEEHFEAARQLGKGLIVATAHLGSFEVGMADLCDKEDRVYVVYQRDRLAGFEKLRHRLHRSLGVIEAPVEQGVEVWMQLRDALKNDEVVLIQADRVMPGQKGAVVPFCGGHIEIPTGPWKLARLSGSPILPVFTIRQPNGKIRIVIEPLIEIDQTSSADADQPPEALLKLAAVIEKHVRANPEQWLKLHRAWLEDQCIQT